MMKKGLFGRAALAVAVILISTLIAWAQAGDSAANKGSAGVVKARGYVSTDAIGPGDKFKIAIELEIAPGYHIQGHVPSESFLIATEVKFQPLDGIKISEPVYPAPKYQKLESLGADVYAVHDGTIYITADAEGDSAAVLSHRVSLGSKTIRATFTAQACNDRVCLAP